MAIKCQTRLNIYQLMLVSIRYLEIRLCLGVLYIGCQEIGEWKGKKIHSVDESLQPVSRKINVPMLYLMMHFIWL